MLVFGDFLPYFESFFISVVQFKITFSIRDYKDAGTSDLLYVKMIGSDGRQTAEELCEADFNVTNRDVMCTFKSIDVGYKCIALRTGGSDQLQLTKVGAVAGCTT